MSEYDRGKVLVVDDDRGQRSLLSSFLGRLDFDVVAVASGEEALAAIARHRPGMLISDVRMPGMSGLDLLERVRADAPRLPVLLVTAYADVRDAVTAMREGAVDYLEKPIDLDELLRCVRRALGLENARRAEPAAGFTLPAHVVAESAAMREVFREAALLAPSDTRVLITGESGTGKEVVADVIHLWSPRARGPMVKVNCAAIPETLLESELFGHEKGAFTGATGLRIGRFEEASGGTIMLDEVAEMSPALQAKLLRVTQDGTFNRVGANGAIRTDVRILAATNRNLEEEVEQGRFREDLFYRLNVIEVHVPALRERPADIHALANHFASSFSGGKARFSPGATAALTAYDWPGNVRELRNAMERAALLARGELLLPEHLPERVRRASDNPASDEPAPETGTTMEDIERDAILRTLRDRNYNRTETARTLGISRRALTYKLRDYREQGYQTDPG